MIQSKKHALPKAQRPPKQCVRRARRHPSRRPRTRRVRNGSRHRKATGLLVAAARVPKDKAVKVAGKDRAAKAADREIGKAGEVRMEAVRADGAIEVTTGGVAIEGALKGRPKSTSKS